MEKIAANIITSLGYNGEIHENYSGRGMFGNPTTGIDFDEKDDFYKALAYVMREGSQTDRETVAAAIENIHFDSMGMGIIVY